MPLSPVPLLHSHPFGGFGLRLDKTSLTFTTTNWDDAQTVTVTAAEDDDGVTDAVATLTHTISGGGYASTTVPNVEVSITENDTANIVLSEPGLTLTEGDAVGSSYTVKLATKPSGTVSVSITGHADTDLSLDKTTLTFIVNDWDTPQTVTVEAGQDDDTVNDFEADAYTVSEGSMATITVTLSADPQSTVVIPITATNQGGATSSDYSIVSSSVTFNSGDTSQTITFSAKEDTEDELGESVLLAFGTNLPSGVSAGTPSQTTVSINDDCADGDIWCATLNFSTGSFDSSERLSVNQIDTEDFLYDSVDYQLIDIRVIQNGHHGGDDVNVKLPFGIPERTKWSMDFRNLNSGTGSEQFEILTEDWRDWTLHVSTVSGGDTLTAALRFSEARYTGQAWWWWFGRDIDHLRRVWQPGQLYKVRLVEDPRSERTPQPLNPPMYLRVQGVVNTTQVHLRWLGPQMRDDQLAPVDRYKIQVEGVLRQLGHGRRRFGDHHGPHQRPRVPLPGRADRRVRIQHPGHSDGQRGRQRAIQ